MPKVCDVCAGKHYAKGKCAIHYKMPSQLNPKPIQRTAIKAPAKNVILLGGTWQPVKTAIKKVSDRRAAELRIYAKLCPQFKKDNPVCQAKLGGCTGRTVDVHHMRGKENKRLNEVKYFLAVCRSCHDIIGDNNEMAKELGFSINRTITESILPL